MNSSVSPINLLQKILVEYEGISIKSFPNIYASQKNIFGKIFCRFSIRATHEILPEEHAINEDFIKYLKSIQRNHEITTDEWRQATLTLKNHNERLHAATEYMTVTYSLLTFFFSLTTYLITTLIKNAIVFPSLITVCIVVLLVTLYLARTKYRYNLMRNKALVNLMEETTDKLSQ